MILIPVSHGELIDKITILSIKQERLPEDGAREHVTQELDLLRAAMASSGLVVEDSLLRQLGEVNAQLWQIEDELRSKEARHQFDDGFIALARSVYRLNDRRAALKRQINLQTNSSLIEQKSYK